MINCALCLYDPGMVSDDDEESMNSAYEAITITQGYAVCEEHLAYIGIDSTLYRVLNEK